MQHTSRLSVRTVLIAVIAIWAMGFCLPDAKGQVTGGNTVTVVAGQALELDALAPEAGADSALVEILVAPSHGTVAMEPSGTWVYRPEAGFVGRDSLSFRRIRIPAGIFTVDSVASVVNFAADLAIPNLGQASDQTTLAVSGDLGAVLWPGAAPYDSVAVTGFALTNTDAASLSFSYGDLGITVLTVEVGVAEGQLGLTLLEAGPTAVSGFAGLFTQEANEVGVVGAIQVSGSGPLGGLVPAGQQDFDTSTSIPLSGLAMASGDSAQVILNLDITQSVDLAGNAADLRITGEVVARGRVPVVTRSEMATVYIEVISGLSVTKPERLGLALYPNPTPGVVRATLTEPAEVEVFNMLGRRIHSGPVVRGVVADLSRQPPGLYLIRITTQSGGEGVRTVLRGR